MIVLITKFIIYFLVKTTRAYLNHMMISHQKNDGHETNSSSDELAVAEIPSVWRKLDAATPDPVFGLIHVFLKDECEKKVLLGVGAYRDDAGKPFVLESVRRAEKILLDKKLDKEYAFPDGIPSFRKKAVDLAYGPDHVANTEDRIASMQTVSGTGALRMGFAMLKSFYPKPNQRVYVPNPTWSLHHNIIERAGFDLHYFRYYKRETKGIDIEGMLEDLEAMEDE